MALMYGAWLQQDNPADYKPHILSFTTPRTASGDTLLEIWNGSAVGNIKAAVDKAGRYHSSAWTAGDMFYAVTGYVSNVRQMESLAIGTAYQIMVVNGSGNAPLWVTNLPSLKIQGISSTTGWLEVAPMGGVTPLSNRTHGIFAVDGTHEASGGNQTIRGMWFRPTINADGQTLITGMAMDFQPQFGGDGESFTTGYGLYMYLRGYGAGTTTVTTLYGIRIQEAAGELAGTTVYGIYIDTFTSHTNNYALWINGGKTYIAGEVTINTTLNVTGLLSAQLGLLVTEAGIQVGSPTGGNKGAGTINVDSDIYKNNTAYTNPDAVLEKVFTGKVEIHKDSPFADYPGLMSLTEVEAYVKEKFQLPRVGKAEGIFERGDVALEKIEEIFCYLFEHERLLSEERRWR
jgi:hypothetical protein